LTSGDSTAREGGQFRTPVLIVGDGTPGMLAGASNPTGISIAVNNTYCYLAWSDAKGVWVAKAPITSLSDSGALQSVVQAASPPELIISAGVLGDIAISHDGDPTIAYSTASGIFIATYSSSRWTSEKVCDSGSEPVIEYDGSGKLHLAYRSQRETPFFGKLAIDPRIAYTVRSGG